MRILVLAMLLLTMVACSSKPKVVWEGDGAPAVAPNPEDIADAIPRPDPILRAGNTSPYVVNDRQYEVLPTAIGYREEGVASWYGTKFHGNKTSNGEIYDLYLATAAHRSLPIPSYLRVTNLENGRAITVRVNDRGPFHSERLIDLSYGAALKLGFVDNGTAPVRVEAINLAGIDDRRADYGSYRYLQLGAFSSQQAAASLRDAVAALVTVPVNITPVDVQGKRLSRVRVGPVADGKQLQQLRQLLMTRGYSPGLSLP